MVMMRKVCEQPQRQQPPRQRLRPRFFSWCPLLSLLTPFSFILCLIVGESEPKSQGHNVSRIVLLASSTRPRLGLSLATSIPLSFWAKQHFRRRSKLCKMRSHKGTSNWNLFEALVLKTEAFHSLAFIFEQDTVAQRALFKIQSKPSRIRSFNLENEFSL